MNSLPAQAMLDAAQPAEVSAESVSELRRDAATMVDDMIQHVSSIRARLDAAPEGVRVPSGDRLRRDTDRLLNSLAAARPGVVDLTALLRSQPRPADFAFPARATALATEARRRMARSKYMFPEPTAVLDAAASLLDAPAEDRQELRVRLAHALSRLNAPRDGLGVSAACRRLLEAAACARSAAPLTPDQITLLAAAKASLQSYLYEARRHGSR